MTMRYWDIFFREKKNIDTHPHAINAVQVMYSFVLKNKTVYHALVSQEQYDSLTGRFPASLLTWDKMVKKEPDLNEIVHHFAGRAFIADPTTRKIYRLDGTEEDIDE